MTSYYETINIQPTDNQAEIQAAIDAQYNQWRRLVTHHDPAMVDEANRKLRTLEEIRSTLTDRQKKAEYDRSLTIGGVGGLSLEGQPASRPSPPVVLSPPRPRDGSVPQPRTADPAAAMRRVDAWICQKCETANGIGQPFCAKCGNKIGIDCPSCGRKIEAVASFCPYCGKDVDAVLRTKMEARIRELQALVQEEQAAIQGLSNKANKPLLLGGEAGTLYNENVGSFSRFLHTVLTLAALFGLLFLSYSFFNGVSIGFLLISFIPVGFLYVWLRTIALKPVLRKHMQTHLDRIAELEQQMREVQRTGMQRL